MKWLNRIQIQNDSDGLLHAAPLHDKIISTRESLTTQLLWISWKHTKPLRNSCFIAAVKHLDEIYHEKRVFNALLRAAGALSLSSINLILFFLFYIFTYGNFTGKTIESFGEWMVKNRKHVECRLDIFCPMTNSMGRTNEIAIFSARRNFYLNLFYELNTIQI